MPTAIKIALTGAHGTGKTTLCKQLALEGINGRSTGICREMPRVIVEHLQDSAFFQRANNSIQRQLVLFSHQIIEECEATKRAECIICDRTVIDHLAYTAVIFPEFYGTPEYDALALGLRRWLATYDQIFYVPIEFTVLADGVREDDIQFQKSIDSKIRDLYKEFGISTLTISGSLSARAEIIRTNLR